MEVYNFENILKIPLIFDNIFKYLDYDSKKKFIVSKKTLFIHYLSTIKEYEIIFNENITNNELCNIIDKIKNYYPNLQIIKFDLKNTNGINYDNIILNKFQSIKELYLYNIPQNFKLSFLQNQYTIEILELNFINNEFIFNCNEIFNNINNIQILKITNCHILNFDNINKLKELKSLVLENIKEIKNENKLMDINSIKYLTIRYIKTFDFNNFINNKIEELILEKITDIKNFELIYNMKYLKRAYLYLNFINYNTIAKLEKNKVQIMNKIKLKYKNNEGKLGKFKIVSKTVNIMILVGNKKINEDYYYSDESEKEIELIIKGRIKNFSSMFSSCEYLYEIDGLKNLDVSNGYNFEFMFYGCHQLQNLDGLSNWNISNGNNFQCMFLGCKQLQNLDGLSNWNVSNGTDFSAMFYGCHQLQNLDGLSKWNVSSGKDFRQMFIYCEQLENLNGLSNWNVSNGIYFHCMFHGCKQLQNLDGLSNWNVSNGTNFNTMFKDCNQLKNLDGLSNWDVSKGEDFDELFRDCSQLQNLDGLINWNVLRGRHYKDIFLGCNQLQKSEKFKNSYLFKKFGCKI